MVRLSVSAMAQDAVTTIYSLDRSNTAAVGEILHGWPVPETTPLVTRAQQSEGLKLWNVASDAIGQSDSHRSLERSRPLVEQSLDIYSSQAVCRVLRQLVP